MTKSFRFLDFELDGVRRVLNRNGEPIDLNSKSFDLLLALVESRGEVVTKDELLDRVWPGQFVEEGNLKVQISTLRKIFGSDRNDHEFIVTVPGRGYSFVADILPLQANELIVESHSFSDIVVEQADSYPERPVNASELGRLIEAPHPTRRKSVYLGAMSAAILLIGGLLYWSWSGTAAFQPSAIAVMPFANETGNADLEFLSDGLTESLIENLSQLSGLSVKARTSISRYKGKEIDLAAVAKELGVDAVVTGRLVQRGETLGLYVEFVEPASGNVIWTANYHQPANDIATLERQVARDVAARVKAKISGEESARMERFQTNNSEAYELYLRGVHFSRAGSTPERLKKSVECYEQAIKLDPNYVQAYVGLAWTYMRTGSVYGYAPASDTYPKAREALLKAIELNDSFAPAHSGLASFYLNYEWNWAAAEREFQRAHELDPDDPGVLSDIGNFYETVGRFDDALSMREASRKLAPTSAVMVANVGTSYFSARRYSEAIEAYSRALELDPRQAWAHRGIGRCYMYTGRPSEGLDEIRKASDLFGDDARSLAVLGNAYAVAGDRAKAIEILTELERRATTEYVAYYFLAMIYAGLEDETKTLDHLEKAFGARENFLIRLRVEPAFDKLRGNERFDALLKRIGIPQH